MSELTITKTIPSERAVVYQNLGWSLYERLLTGESCSSVRKVLKTQAENDYHADADFSTPYLIQRGLINRPLGQHTDLPLSHAVRLDYMGSAEFEYGALPRSLRKMESQWSLYSHHKFEDIVAAKTGDSRKFQLRVFANFDSEANKEQYRQWMVKAFAGNLYLKENLGASTISRINLVELSPYTDFWWDITNDVLFSFDKQFMSRIESHLKASFAALNNQ